MRKFIVSDLHGVGDIYFPLISFLTNLNKEEEVCLFINGDLIDRGKDSYIILPHLLNMIDDENNFRVIYLGGNHEYMMYKLINDLEHKKFIPDTTWFDASNGGRKTFYDLSQNGYDGKDIINFKNEVGDLPIYHLFNEEIGGKKIVLVHAKCPSTIEKDCNIYIKDLNIFNDSYVWFREEDLFKRFNNTGNKNYFTIIGHTPINNKDGYYLYKKGDVLNIDGGCARYALGLKEYDHIPIIEVCEDYLKIITFNMNNEIIKGDIFDGNTFTSIDDISLNNYRKYLDTNPYERKRK